MIVLLCREFVVAAPVEMAWEHLARVKEWPSWARHIRSVEVRPAGALGPESVGVIRLRNGITSAFAMSEFRPYQNWKWVGGFLWLTVHYDHRFEAIDSMQTKLTWTVEAEGFGAAVFGRLFAKIYERNLDRAIPLLFEEMNAAKAQ